VGPAPSSKSYLNVARILGAIAKTGAQAVHPGYGFLSENAAFAKVLEERGIKFIGPSSHAITAMGDKIESKLLAVKAGVNTVPGYMGVVADDGEAVRIAREIGYPVMIKASAGGGGKGMRVAYNDAEVRLGYRLSKEEAKSSFGDDRLFVEKFIEDPRHIEIQLIADAHGNVVAMPERECSIQRRNQKVIEESPSVLLDAATRRAMQDQACQLARAVGYESAGTVEFLADKHRNFYFLEMNTRLQVEHPVTEMVTGVDLVELMLRVAAGERLPPALTGAPVPILGHAFESRVYAEDPFRGFLPSTGRLSQYAEPQAAGGVDPYLAQPGTVRTDAGVQEGSEISMFYDPMICKLVTHGADRDAALDRMRAALDAYVIRGVGHNVSFLRALVDHPRFRSGRITTQFIREEYPEGFRGVQLAPEDRLHVVAAAAIMHAVRELAMADVTGRLASAQLPDVAHVVVTLGVDAAVAAFDVNLAVEGGSGSGSGSGSGAEEDADVEWVVAITPRGMAGGGAAAAAGVPPPTVLRWRGLHWSPEAPLLVAHMTEGPVPAVRAGWPSAATIRLQHLARLPDGFRLQYQGATEEVHVRSPRAHALAAHMRPKPKRDTSRLVVSPMPGTLVSLAVAPGDAVEAGQEVAVVEAMKMQNVLRAPRKGVIKAVPRKTGDTLAVDQVIMEFEA
jgi:propionyl-CoA carboxylase alpha chain